MIETKNDNTPKTDDIEPPKPGGLPPFIQIARGVFWLDLAIVAVLFFIGSMWLGLGALAGAVTGFAVIWTLHLVSRVVPQYFLESERDRRAGLRFGNTASARNAALFRLAGLLLAKYAGLTVGMMLLFQFARQHIIPFLLTFTVSFSITQLGILISAARLSRIRK
ncbi:MAG: hypothetical protein JWQ02_2467 [Capsulimonas sp.]|nr:hypothetical protein [Capsulimonas sp.]